MLTAGVMVAPGSVPIGPVLISVGALVLLLGFALPLVSQVELGAPMLVKVIVSARERRERLRSSIEDCRGLLVACARSLCRDADSSARAVEVTVSNTLGLWHGTDSEALRRYLLCVLVRQAQFEATIDPPPPPPTTERFLRLPFLERAVLVLKYRAGLDESSIGRILGVPGSAIATIRARAMAGLGLPDDAP
jgi:DNA-directed RNA polymerase specialized sigma24 family protein